MYDYIKGLVTRVTPEYMTVEQQGIGWQIFTPNPYAFRVSAEPQQIFTHLNVREDAHLLFGFVSLEQRELFRKLIQVSGIGPKGALAILASGQPSQVVQAIEREDETFLVKFPGVGKKTARQMILDLKGKLGDLSIDSDMVNGEDELQLFPETSGRLELEEAFLALAALGYSERELTKVRPKLDVLPEALDTEGYMKKALQLLLKQG
ncbi:Holliday junction branch migration protein RuvA [Paenisporosarcina sp. TG-14]|uniref:Holliday junction branch migration protein RuvA n=1 Tax=Paenisporosarcina sp. TG-14 TaxID=1231057 RepID=UPI000305AB95|nr:Holliday junction branch migration protein RuvA [Paenisporosarcina sp. TG-14]